MDAGEIFEGKYRIDGQLGVGGQSRVFRAEELTTGRRVAIKVLGTSGDGVRFIREGRVVSRLANPHTVRLIEFGRSAAGPFFLVYEFVAGEDLAHVVRREGAMQWARVARLVDQVLQALAEAHELGIVHRDIKPSNIMLAPGGEAKLLDFGIARLDDTDSSGITETGEVLGTPRYVSPEALAGERVTAQADVYAVGLVAWELVAGRPANDARFGADIVLMHLDPTPYRLPADLDIPIEAKRWIMHLCEKDPKRRPRDANEALAALHEFEAPPAPLVTMNESPVDRSADDGVTRMLAASEIETTGEQTRVVPFEPTPDLDPTDPDPWRPTELEPSMSPEVAQAPPPQPASTGIPRQVPDRPRQTTVSAPSNETATLRPFVVVAVVLAMLAMLWLALR